MTIRQTIQAWPQDLERMHFPPESRGYRPRDFRTPRTADAAANLPWSAMTKQMRLGIASPRDSFSCLGVSLIRSV